MLLYYIETAVNSGSVWSRKCCFFRCLCNTNNKASLGKEQDFSQPNYIQMGPSSVERKGEVSRNGSPQGLWYQRSPGLGSVQAAAWKPASQCPDWKLLNHWLAQVRYEIPTHSESFAWRRKALRCTHQNQAATHKPLHCTLKKQSLWALHTLENRTQDSLFPRRQCFWLLRLKTFSASTLI